MIPETIYFILPGLIGNMTPSIVAWMFGDRLAWPADFGLKLRGRRLLGKNKTVRAIFSATLFGGLTMFVQQQLYLQEMFASVSLLDYSIINPWAVGCLMGFAAIFGDMLKSLVKRQLGIRPSKPFIPFDQMDVPIGFSLIVFPFLHPPFSVILLTFVISPILAAALNIIGYLLRIRKTAW